MNDHKCACGDHELETDEVVMSRETRRHEKERCRVIDFERASSLSNKEPIGFKAMPLVVRDGAA